MRIGGARGHAIATTIAATLAWTASAEIAAAQTRTFDCPKGRAVTLTVIGPNSITAGPIEGRTIRLKQDPRDSRRYFDGDYAVRIAPSQTEITVEIPDWGAAKCTFRPATATPRPPTPRPGLGNTDPCGPGFRQVPETDRCDPVPGNVDPKARPARRTGTQEGRFPMEGRSLGGIMRAAPTQASQRIASVPEGNTVTILGRAGPMDGYDWFKIEYQGRVGYQWGGIMCSQNPIRGIFQQCEP